MKSCCSTDSDTPQADPKRVRLVAIVGNPNAGKTTLFNGLTGSHQKVGNYPGVTVEKVVGKLVLPNSTVDCVDVPGMYSLTPVSEDERVASEVVLGKQGLHPDLLVCVVDATNLERNLYLFTQLAEVGQPVLIALTMVDRLKQQGKEVDLTKMSNMLGVEVVPLVGHKDKGLSELKEAIERNLESPRIPICELGLPVVLETQTALIRERMARFGVDLTKAEVRQSLIHPTPEFESYLRDFPEIHEAYLEAREHLGEVPDLEPHLEVSSRYQWASVVQRVSIREVEEVVRKRSVTDRIDLILTHRVFGLIVFVGIMYLVFQSIYTFAKPLMDFIQSAFDKLAQFTAPKLAGVPILQSLIVDGIIKGVGSMLVFLPQILILFFFISVLEGSGYLARAAFLMDRLLGWCGLNGKAFIPLLSSFACAIPGIMAARVMPDPKSRLATILVAPLMSCSARLPVYLLLVSTFIQPKYGSGWAGFTLFAMHLLGLFVAIPIVWLFNRKMLKGKRLPFLLELPPYQWPRGRDVWLAMVFRGKIFVKTAGTIIVFMSTLIWALGYFPHLPEERVKAIRAEYAAKATPTSEAEGEAAVQEEQLSHSALGRFGKVIEPVFVPAGFDWRITTSILSAFPARETVVPSLGIIFSLGGDVEGKEEPLEKALAGAKWPDGKPLFTPWVAVGLMVFFALCAQCMATLATVKRETNSWKWAAFMFCYMTLLAYLAAVGIHQLGRLLGAA